MSHRPMRLPASLGELAFIMVFMVGAFASVIIVGYTALWGVKTLLSIDYMTVLTHLIVGWIGATIGLIIGSKEDNS